MPLPKEIRFWACAENPYLWVAVTDKAGQNFTSKAPVSLKSSEWSQAIISVPKDAARDLDSIAVLTVDALGENQNSGPKEYKFGQFELVYPAGEGPINKTFTKQDLEDMLRPLDPSIIRIDKLIEQAQAKGAETRYFRSSLAVLKRYSKEVYDMIPESDPMLAERSASFLLDCAQRTEAGLNEAIRHPENSIRVPNVDLMNLSVREASFFAGKRPVVLAGEYGWFAQEDFDYLSNVGFTLLGEEVGPSHSLTQGVQRRSPYDGAMIDYLKTKLGNLDAAANHNMKIEEQLSPHDMPESIYDKWPDLDPENRRANNPFMPWDVRSEHLREIISRHIETTIPLLKDKPALLSYNLVNEAWYRPFYGADMTVKYTTDKVDEFFKWYLDEVQTYDKSHPIYCKVFGSEEVLCMDREALGDMMPANGMDGYPMYPDFTGELAADFAWTLLRLDFHRSLTPDKPILDGEYHVSNGMYDAPDNYFRTALWDAALHGKDSMTLWAYGRADQVSVDCHPNCVEVLGHTALDFLRLGPEIHAFQRQRGKLAIFYGGAGTREAYLASLFQDCDVSIVTKKRALGGALSKYKLLIIPSGSEITPDVTARIEAFRKAGGMVFNCIDGVDAPDLWPQIHQAVIAAKIPRLVCADKWGVECRGVRIGNRKLFYLINHNKKPVCTALKSGWKLDHGLELRSMTKQSAKEVDLEPLEMKIIEVI